MAHGAGLRGAHEAGAVVEGREDGRNFQGFLGVNPVKNVGELMEKIVVLRNSPTRSCFWLVLAGEKYGSDVWF